MKIVVKGLNFTEMRTSNKRDSWLETIQFWRLATRRKPEDCGVWKDGKKILTFTDMQDKGLTTEIQTRLSARQEAEGDLQQMKKGRRLY